MFFLLTNHNITGAVLTITGVRSVIDIISYPISPIVMIRTSGPRLNLYNFFSVLLPGVTFVLGISPFLPSETKIDPLIGVVPLLAGGFVFGQAIHSLAVIWQSRTPRRTHREQFQELLKGETLPKYEGVDDDPAEEIVTRNTLEDFHEACDTRFDGIELPDFENREEASADTLRDLYTLVRGAVHFDGRGRSRTFQAIYAFCRSMWVLSIVLWVIYYTYVGVRLLDVPAVLANHVGAGPNNTLIYTPLLTEYVPSPETVLILSTAIFLSSHKMFRSSTDEYKRYFTEYLISDFLLVNDDETLRRD